MPHQSSSLPENKKKKIATIKLAIVESFSNGNGTTAIDVPYNVVGVQALLRSYNFSADETKLIIYDLEIGEHSKSGKSTKIEFVQQRVLEHQKRCESEFPSNQDDKYHSDDSVENSELLSLSWDDSASRVPFAPVTGLSAPRASLTSLRACEAATPSLAHEGMFPPEMPPPRPVPKSTPAPPESSVLQLGQGEVLGDPTVKPRPHASSDEQRAMITAAMDEGFTFEQAISLLENRQKEAREETESAARALASQMQGCKNISAAQIAAFSRQKYISENPEVARQLFGLKPDGDEPQNQLPLLLNQNSFNPKRKRSESFMVWIRKNTGLTYGPNLDKCSTPIAVQALPSFVESTALFAFNKLAYSLQKDPRLREYGIHRKGHSQTFEEGSVRITCTSKPLDEETLRCLVKLVHDDPTATVMPPVETSCNLPPIDWDNLDPSVLRKSVVSRLGIADNGALAMANSNALLLLPYAQSLCMHKTEDGVVTISDVNWAKLEGLPAYVDIIHSAAVQDLNAFRLKVHGLLPFRPPRQYDAEQLINYAFEFGQLLNLPRPNNISGREVWIRAVGKDLRNDHVRLCTFLYAEQTMWKGQEFFTAEYFASVLSDFIGNIGDSRMVLTIAPTVRDIIRNGWVTFSEDHIRNPSTNHWVFSTLAFKSITRVFALVLVINNLSAKRIGLIRSKTHSLVRVTG
jgi:hypothetical protein